MTLSLTPGAMTRRLRVARLGVIRSYALAEGALRVYAYGTDEARAISAHLIQLGYDAVATGDRVTVTLPEPVEEPAPAVTYRKVGEALYEVVRDGQAIGRVARTTPAHATFTARWASYTTTGERVASGSYTRDDAADALESVLADRAHEAAAARITTREELIARQVAQGITPERAAMIADARDALQAELTATAPAIAAVLDASLPEPAPVVVEPATVERYRAPSGNRDEDRFRAVHSACGWRSLAWHSNRTVEGRRLAERDARQHRCPEPVVHLMSNALLDACGTAGPGGLHLAPSTTPERITCPACRRLAEEEAAADAAVEADLPPTEEDRVTVRIRARELRRGDLVVDSLGEHQYAVFDTDAGTHIRDGALVRVWTAVRDQERGLPPVLTVPAERELLVLRPMSEEGRELAARAGWVDAPDRAQQGDDSTVIVVDGFRPHVNTTVRCLGCGQLITVNVDGDTECGGAGEGTCDALDGHAGPVEDSHHDAADAAHDALLGYQLAHEARA